MLSDGKFPKAALEPIECVISDERLARNAEVMAYVRKMRTPLPDRH